MHIYWLHRYIIASLLLNFHHLCLRENTYDSLVMKHISYIGSLGHSQALSIQSRGGVSINASGHAAVRPAPACTRLHQFTKHARSEAAGLAPRVGGDIICFHAILAQECPGTICLSVQPGLPLSLSLSLLFLYV